MKKLRREAKGRSLEILMGLRTKKLRTREPRQKSLPKNRIPRKPQGPSKSMRKTGRTLSPVKRMMDLLKKAKRKSMRLLTMKQM